MFVSFRPETRLLYFKIMSFRYGDYDRSCSIGIICFLLFLYQKYNCFISIFCRFLWDRHHNRIRFLTDLSCIKVLTSYSSFIRLFYVLNNGLCLFISLHRHQIGVVNFYPTQHQKYVISEGVVLTILVWKLINDGAGTQSIQCIFR